MDEPKRNPYEDDSEVDYYIQMLHSEDDEERFKAVNVLAWLKNKRAVEPLIESLDLYVYPHGWICEALAELGDVRAVEPLIAYYNATKNYMALTALGKLKDKRAIPILLEALKTKDFNIQREAAKAIGQFGGPEVVAPLIEILKMGGKVTSVIADVLGELGDVAVLPLLELLSSENSKVKAFAAHALSKIADKRAVEPLISALKDTNHQVVRNAAYALANIGDSRAADPLLNFCNILLMIKSVAKFYVLLACLLVSKLYLYSSK